VPRVERGEQLNVGVILSCPDLDFLDARIELDDAAVLALDPQADLDTLRGNLERYRWSAGAEPRPAQSAGSPRVAASGGWFPRAARSSSHPPCTRDAPAIPLHASSTWWRSWSADERIRLPATPPDAP
jgi:hypothetical protein